MSISFTIPKDPEVLRATAKLLLNLAGDGCGCSKPVRVAPAVSEAPEAPAVDPAVATVPVTAPAPPAAPEAPAAVPPPPAAMPPAAPGPVVELDGNGFPWDERIHAKTKTKMKDGAWKLKRGSDPAMVETVRAETTSAAVLVDPPAAAAPPVAPEVPAAPEAGGAPTDFPGIVAIVHNKQHLDLLTVEEIQGVCTAYGLPSFPALAAKQELIPDVYKALEAIWTARTAS